MKTYQKYFGPGTHQAGESEIESLIIGYLHHSYKQDTLEAAYKSIANPIIKNEYIPHIKTDKHIHADVAI